MDGRGDLSRRLGGPTSASPMPTNSSRRGPESGLQQRKDRQRVPHTLREAADPSDRPRCKAASQWRGEIAKLLDSRDRADRGAFANAEEPRPQLNREVTFPTRGSSDHVKHHLGHSVEHHDGAGQPFSDSRDQPVDLIALEVREQTLRRDEDRVRRIQLLNPTQIECRPAMTRLSWPSGNTRWRRSIGSGKSTVSHRT